MSSADTPLSSRSQALNGQEHEIDFVELGLKLWRQKWLGVAFVVGFIGIAITYLNIVKYQYTAELTVTPADQSGSKVPGNLASLGSLVGMDLGGEAGSAFAMYAEAVKAYPVAERLSRDPKLMHTVFKASWDEKAGRWREPQSSVKPAIVAIKGLLGVPIRPWQPPSAVDLKSFIEKNVIVKDDKKKALIKLSFGNENPNFAGYFLQKVSSSSDDFLREKSLARASTYINYLEIRLNQVRVSEYRQSLSQALSNYEKIRMMASSEASFAAEPFGDVWVSPKPTSPKPLIVLFLSAVMGVIAWSVYIIVIKSIIDIVRAKKPLIETAGSSAGA